MNETLETMVVTPRTSERTHKLPPNHPSMEFPKHIMDGHETVSSMGTAGSYVHNTRKSGSNSNSSSNNNNVHNINNTSYYNYHYNSKVSEDLVNLHYRQNFGKDGIYVPPVTAARRLNKKMNMTAITDDHDQTNSEDSNNNRNKGPRIRIPLTSTRMLDDGYFESDPSLPGETTSARSSFQVSAPEASLSVTVVDERGADNDVPFDQANDDNAAREMVATFRDGYDGVRTHRLRNGSGSSSRSSNENHNATRAVVVTPIPDPSTPLSNPAVIDLEASCFPVASTRFESIWTSTPDGSTNQIGRVTSTSRLAKHQQPSQHNHIMDGTGVGLVERALLDELDESLGRFTLPPPKLSGPNPTDDSLTLNVKLSPELSGAPSYPTDRFSIKSAEVGQINNNNTGKELATHRIQSYKDKPGNSHTALTWQEYHNNSDSAIMNNINNKNGYGKATSTGNKTSDPSCNAFGRKKTYDQPGPACARPGAMMPPTSNWGCSGVNDEVDSIFDSVLEMEDERLDPLGVDEEPDNLYKNVRVTHKVRRRSRQRRKVQTVPLLQLEKGIHDADDDTSTENYGANPAHATSLQERAHQAWKSRQQKKNSSFRSKPDGGAKSKKVANVSFGAPNTVHHFEPEPPLLGNEDEEDLTSVDKSLNSEYTKTLESEVEDMIKDILFIGNPKSSKPGRRRIRDKPEIRRKTKQRRVPTTGDRKGDLGTLHENQADSGDESVSDLPPVYEPRWMEKKDDRSSRKTNKPYLSNDSLNSAESKGSRSLSTSMGDDRSTASSRTSSVDANTVETFQSERDTSDPFVVVMGFLEGGMTAMSSAMGFGTGDDDSKGRQQGGAEGEKDTGPTQSSMDGLNIFDACTGRQPGSSIQGNTPLSDVVGMLAQDLWFGPSLGTSQSSSGQLRSMDSEGSYDVGNRARELGADDHETAEHLSQLGSSSELHSLAVHAAHSVHKLQGVEFDESVSIDMEKDLRISFVHLELPLGLIFLENEGGCFVTKVSPDGSAARSLGVEVGDQLASINGISSTRMKVDDICDVIAKSNDPSQVELIFLRYVGPFRPSTTLPVGNNNRQEPDGSHASSSAKTSKSGKSLWRKNPSKVSSSGGFRLFGRGKNKGNKDDKNKPPVKR